MASIEPSTDIGEDVIMMNDAHFAAKVKHKPPGRNLVFGDLFGLQCSVRRSHVRAEEHGVTGPAKCLMYIREFHCIFCEFSIL